MESLETLGFRSVAHGFGLFGLRDAVSILNEAGFAMQVSDRSVVHEGRYLLHSMFHFYTAVVKEGVAMVQDGKQR